MAVRVNYTGRYSWQQIYDGLDFIGIDPLVDVDPGKDRIVFSDREAAGNRILIETDDLVVEQGAIVSGTITGVRFTVNGKDAIVLNGLSGEASHVQPAAAQGVDGLYGLLSELLGGPVTVTGDRFDNLVEIGSGGTATVKAGGGADLIQIWQPKTAEIDGGAGIDTIEFSYYIGSQPQPENGATVDLAAKTGTNPQGGSLVIENVERIVGQFGASNSLKGDGKDNYLRSGILADTLVGRGGDDEIYVKYHTTLDARATLADGGKGKDTLNAELSDSSAAPFTGSGQDVRFINTLDLEDAEKNTGTFHGGTFAHFETYRANAFGVFYVFDFAGSERDEKVYGAGSEDRIDGRAGNDLLAGGFGGDHLTGGGGADRFWFRLTSDSTFTEAGRDLITDFSHAEKDRIDLRPIDADVMKAKNQAFDFIGGKAFSGEGGELRYSKADGIVYGDTNGDGTADFAIEVEGAPKLVGGDFML
jgi:Ca2+-binding RTX toxin-like protein